jgi:hypothetical protein
MRLPTDRLRRGPAWHSLDGGRTWRRGPLPPMRSVASFEVTGVDHERGVITVRTVVRGEPGPGSTRPRRGPA